MIASVHLPVVRVLPTPYCLFITKFGKFFQKLVRYRTDYRLPTLSTHDDVIVSRRDARKFIRVIDEINLLMGEFYKKASLTT